MKSSIIFLILFFISLSSVFCQQIDDEYALTVKYSNEPLKYDTISAYISNYQKELEKAVDVNNNFLIAKYNLYLGQLYYRIELHDIAKEHSEKALNLFINLDSK